MDVSSVQPQSLPPQHLLLMDEGCHEPLREELTLCGMSAPGGMAGYPLVSSSDLSQRPLLAFSRQLLPHASSVSGASISLWARHIFLAARTQLQEQQPWRLHLLPHYGSDSQAGQQRVKLIHAALTELLGKQRRSLLRSLEQSTEAFTDQHSLIQCLLSSPEEGVISIAPAPLPYEQRQILWPFPAGQVPVAEDKSAPSRAFAKLAEAEQRLGQCIQPGQTVVDLGAAPGSWTYLALKRGAHVTALDRAPLREDLMRHPQLKFLQADAFRYRPTEPVDWLICDVIADAEKLTTLLLDWLRSGLARRFVFTIKFRGSDSYHQLQPLRLALPSLCSSAYLTHLSANKNEVTALGEVVPR